MDKLKFTKRVLFIGVPDMGLVCLNALLYAGINVVGVIGPEEAHNTYDAFKSYVDSRKLNFIKYKSLDESELLKTVRELSPDIALVCSFNTKIPKSFLDLVKDGVINVHPSLLPKYRGGNPYSRVIENGEDITGVTLHYMTENFDEGDIIAQEKCEISPYETMGTIFEKTNEMACNMLLKVLFYYEQNGTLPSKPQPDGEFPKANNYKYSEQFVPFNKSAVEIERFIRALNPYVTALTVFRNQLLRIHKVSIHLDNDFSEYEAGQICKIDGNKVYIKTSQGCVVPEVMQYAGFFIGDCEDFVKIVQPEVGEKFGNGQT